MVSIFFEKLVIWFGSERILKNKWISMCISVNSTKSTLQFYILGVSSLAHSLEICRFIQRKNIFQRFGCRNPSSWTVRRKLPNTMNVLNILCLSSTTHSKLFSHSVWNATLNVSFPFSYLRSYDPSYDDGFNQWALDIDHSNVNEKMNGTWLQGG